MATKPNRVRIEMYAKYEIAGKCERFVAGNGIGLNIAVWFENSETKYHWFDSIDWGIRLHLQRCNIDSLVQQWYSTTFE